MSPDPLSIGELATATQPWQLPASWAWAPLGLLTSVISRGRAPSYVNSGGVLVLNQRCIRWHRIDFGYAKQTSESSFHKYPNQLIVQDGDILWNSTGSGTIGRAAIYRRPEAVNGPVLIDTHISIVRCANCLPEYVSRFLSTLHAQKIISDLNVGSTNQLELPRSAIAELQIPLPPMSEQRRIAARIDELFAEIGEGEAALERTRQGLNTWRRALLKAAVTGELTRAWREANRPAETGGNTVIITRDGRLDTLGPYAIPSGWIWTTIGQAGQVLLGRQRAPQHHSGPHMRPYLRVANVLEDRIDTSDVKFMNFTPAEFNKYHLQSGDILLNEGQSSDLVGRSDIYRGEIEGCCFQKTLLLFRASEAVIPEYAQIVFLHYLHSKRFRRTAPITTNMAHLTLERLLTIEFPLPPKKEQQVIVHRSREMGDTIEDMNFTIGDRERGALRQSVLKAAFEGRLVPQDPADEPASALLARLRNGHPGNGARRRRARTAADFSHPSLPGLTRQSVDPRVEPAGDE
jgi:type I restriction enzyme S subunit